MRAFNIYNAIILAVLFFAVLEVYAVDVSVTAGSGGSGSVGLSTGHNTGYNTAVDDSAVLSFNGGLGVQKQMSVQGGSGDLHEVHEATSPNGAVAEVTVDLDGAESYTYGYILDPDPTATKETSATKAASASENLDVVNADNIAASAYGVSAKGDNAYQSLTINSESGQACLSGYSNKATADANSATATQSFDLAKGEVQIAVNGAAWVDDLSKKNDGTPKFYSDANTYGIGSEKMTSSVSSFASTSSAKFEKTASTTESVASLSGSYFRMDGSAINSEDDTASFSDEIVGLESNDGPLRPAQISEYCVVTSANANSASETQSFGSISSDAFELNEFAVNANSDYVAQKLDACSLNENGVYQPAIIKGYCSNSGDGLKAQKTSATGSISIREASFGAVDLSAIASHANDYSFGEISGSQVSFNKPGGQAYKASLSAAPKATSLDLGTSIKGTDYFVYAEAYSSAMNSFATQTAMPGKTGLTTYALSASSKSTGKSSASIKSKAA